MSITDRFFGKYPSGTLEGAINKDSLHAARVIADNISRAIEFWNQVQDLIKSPRAEYDKETMTKASIPMQGEDGTLCILLTKEGAEPICAWMEKPDASR